MSFNGEGPQTNYTVNHAVLIVGWDDDHQAFLIKNSQYKILTDSAGNIHGLAAWGDHGFGWVAYDSLKIGTRTAWVDALYGPSRINLFP